MRSLFSRSLTPLVALLLLPLGMTTVSASDPLYSAIISGQTDRLAELIDAGADVNATHDDHDTALFTAISHGDESIVEILIKMGADVRQVKRIGKISTVHAAAAQDNDKIIDLLVSAGADVDALDHFKFTPLYHASTRGHLKAITALLDAGADAEKRASRKRTAILAAASQGQLEAMKLLFKGGADIHAERISDVGVYVYAASQQSLKTMKGVEMLSWLYEIGATGAEAALQKLKSRGIPKDAGTEEVLVHQQAILELERIVKDSEK